VERARPGRLPAVGRLWINHQRRGYNTREPAEYPGRRVY
jgi:hypothetical protein